MRQAGVPSAPDPQSHGVPLSVQEDLNFTGENADIGGFVAGSDFERKLPETPVFGQCIGL